MRHLPSRDIATQLILAARKVEEIAGKSSNLKGGFDRQLKEAALSVQIRADALATRGAPEQESTSSLRAEITALMEEVRGLKAERERGWNRPRPLANEPEDRPATCSRDEDVEMAEPSPSGIPVACQQPAGGEQQPGMFSFPTLEDNEAFPALRPPIKGKRKVLVDWPLEAVAGKPSPLERRLRNPPPLAPETPMGAGSRGDVAITEERLEERLYQFQQGMMAEMGRFFQAIKGEMHPSLPKGEPRGAGIQPAAREEIQMNPPASKAGKKGKTKKAEGNAPTTSAPTPKAPLMQEEASWSRVVGRKEKRKQGSQKPTPRPSAAMESGRVLGAKPGKKRIRTPRTAAVTITCPKGGYAEVMAGVRAHVPLATIGLAPEEVSVRRGATGATIVEVGGEKKEEKADTLTAAIKTYLAGRGGDVRVDRPVKTADVRIQGLEASVTVVEVIGAAAEKGQCAAGEIKTGELRTAPRGMSSLWLRLPVAAAKRAAEGGSIYVGWSRARIEVLDARPLRCFKCLERGHARTACPNTIDRSGLCYRCAGAGHVARNCTAPPRCPLCTELGRKAGHALGAPECAPQGWRGRSGAAAKKISPVAAPAAAAAISTAADPATTTKETGRAPAEELEQPKPRRSSRRRTTRPLEDDDEEAISRMEVDSEKEGANNN